MNIKDIQKKYNLSLDDFWEHKQSKSWILTHDACTKIGNQEGIELVDINVINSDPDLVRILVTMKKDSISITTFGEADRKNCFNPYLACMSEKRGRDRAILKLINAYEYGVYSEIEADAFDKKKNVQKKLKPLDMTCEQKEHINSLVEFQTEDIRNKTIEWMKETHTQTQAKKMIKKLESMDQDTAIYESLLKTCMEKLKLDKPDAVLKLNELSSDMYSIDLFDRLPIDAMIQLKDEIALGSHG